MRGFLCICVLLTLFFALNEALLFKPKPPCYDDCDEVCSKVELVCKSGFKCYIVKVVCKRACKKTCVIVEAIKARVIQPLVCSPLWSTIGDKLTSIPLFENADTSNCDDSSTGESIPLLGNILG